MTHKITRFLTLFLLVSLGGCTVQSEHHVPENAAFCDDLTKHVQQVQQLHVASGTTPCPTKTPDTAAVCNYQTTYGMWFPYLDYADTLAGKTAEQFRESMHQRFQQAADMGINTVYLHLRAFGDAYYCSQLFPPAAAVGDFDPLPILLEEAHRLHLSVHGWINPLRLQNDAGMGALSDRYQIGQWYRDSQKNGTYLCKVGDYWWLNPAYPEVRQLIADGVAEIVQQYEVDGIHLDDYFYPTTETAFDAAAFADVKADNLNQFRLSQVNEMIQQIYSTVKAKSPELLLSISPQGTMDGNYTKQYADVRRWGSEAGYCDVLIPQVYFGFENEAAPFSETVTEWVQTVTYDSVSLVIGIGTHKYGKVDQWAGSGSMEWTTQWDLPVRQATQVLETDGTDGRFTTMPPHFCRNPTLNAWHSRWNSWGHCCGECLPISYKRKQQCPASEKKQSNVLGMSISTSVLMETLHKAVRRALFSISLGEIAQRREAVWNTCYSVSLI